MDDLEGRLRNCRNRYQGDYPRVLCVCSAGLLRSPTLAWVLSNPPYNCNVRVAGCRPEYSLVPIDEVLIRWSDHIVAVNKLECCMAKDFIEKISNGESDCFPDLKFWELKIPDQFPFRHPELVRIIKDQLRLVEFPEFNEVT